MVDSAGYRPSSSRVELPAELIGSNRAVPGDPNADHITGRTVRYEHGVAPLGLAPDELVGHDAGDPPRPWFIGQNVHRQPFGRDVGLERRGLGHVRRIALLEGPEHTLRRREVEGVLVRVYPSVQLVGRDV